MNKNNDFKKFRFLGEGFPKGVLFRGDGILHPAFYLKRLTKKKKKCWLLPDSDPEVLHS